ncbi:MAG: hypothetical protein ABEJ34_01720 [Haloferacaceae archaeon]
MVSVRGQAHTLEAVVAGLLLLSSVVFALQVTAVTPLSASTSSQHVENQQQALAEGMLQRTAHSGALRRAVLFWGDADGDTEREFHCAREGVEYASNPNVTACGIAGTANAVHVPPNDFGAAVNETFGTAVAVNVRIRYRTSAGGTDTRRMVYRGQPSDNAVRVGVTVTLTDDNVLYDPQGEPTDRNVGSGGAAFYADDVGDGPLFNVLRVEVTVWRI